MSDIHYIQYMRVISCGGNMKIKRKHETTRITWLLSFVRGSRLDCSLGGYYIHHTKKPNHMFMF